MPASVVSPQWLHPQIAPTATPIADRSLVIIDCRFDLAQPTLGQQQYATSHLPGAVYLDLNRDLSSPVQRHGGRHPLPDSQELANKLANLGVVQGETLVVAYDDSRFAFAARLWWLLRYLGHDRVAVLDGGFKTWEKLGYPTTAEIPEPRSGSFSPQERSELLVNIEAVKSWKDQPGVVLVDSREAGRYRGEYEPIDPIAGHISGAVNYCWQQITREDGTVQDPGWHQHHWADLANAQEIMVYCGSGVTACANLLSLELAGIPNVKLYAGSWSDWCSYL
jgi:thiosulfate/3-mercaptopyruvate sulfurtransferase